MAQVTGFSCGGGHPGGFVVHKALGKDLSAWYDADCNLLDSVLTDSLGRQRKPGKDDLETLKRLGRVYRNTIYRNTIS